MKKFIIILILGLSAILSNPALAGGGLSKNKITQVKFMSEGLLIYGSAWPNPNDCDTSIAVLLSKTDSNYDKAYSLILAAFTAGKSVSGYSDDCKSVDGSTYNTIRGFKYLTVEG